MKRNYGKKDIQGIDEDLVGRLIKEYPIVQDIYDMVESFREILFSKKAEDIDSWLAEGSVNKLKLAKRKMYGRCTYA